MVIRRVRPTAWWWFCRRCAEAPTDLLSSQQEALNAALYHAWHCPPNPADLYAQYGA
jgi:hypothetical protein